ncbi:hypothetical protein Tco_0904712 [Tanacetum coccineum]
MTIQSSVKDKILATSSETSKVENAPAEMLRDLDQQIEKRADDGSTDGKKRRREFVFYGIVFSCSIGRIVNMEEAPCIKDTCKISDLFKVEDCMSKDILALLQQLEILSE